MNQHPIDPMDQMAGRLCRLLDSAANDLPPHVLARLSVAREHALSRFDALVHQAPPAPMYRRDPVHDSWLAPRPVWMRLALTLVPVVLLALAALVGSLFNQSHEAIQQADAYTEMLTAEVPLTAYTDNGFVAHLRSGRMHTSLPASSR